MKRIWSELKAVWLMFIWAACMAFATGLQARAADTLYTVRVVVTGLPADGNTLTVNGSTRTFKTVVASASTQVAIGASAELTAANLVTQLATYNFSGISASRSGANVTLVGTVNQVITASAVGSWGTVTVSTTSLTNFTLRVPIGGNPSGFRELLANHLVEGIDTYATSRFSASAQAFANFMTLATEQTISAKKTYSAQTVISNASSIYTLGQLSNVVARAVKLKQGATLSGAYFENSGGSSVYTIAPDADGKPTLYGLTGDTLGTGPSYSPGDDHLITPRIGNAYYGRLGAANTWTENNTFATILPTLIDGASGAGKTTNLVVHASTLFADSAMFRNHFAASNAAPYLELFQTDASANARAWRFVFNGSTMNISGYSDAGAETAVAMKFSYDALGSDVEVLADVDFQGAVNFASGTITSDGPFYVSGVMVSGSVAPTIPTGLSMGFMMLNSGAVSADPAEGAAVFAIADETFYRAKAANEGAGGNQRLHNRTETVAGSGTDYTFTGSTAAVDFGGTDPTITLPTAGTYLVTATARVIARASANDDIRLKLRNTTAAADIANSDVIVSTIPASQTENVTLEATTTVGASSVIALYGHNATAAAGTVEADGTRISYVRLY